MDASVGEWLNLVGRWIHVITGIAWIGSSFFFNWLDSRLERPAGARPELEGELWMVHSGGFYRVEKIHVAPEELPRTLHWFKWEAGFTWLSGMFLLLLTYHLGSGAILDDPRASGLAEWQASVILLGVLVAAWVIYDLIWASAFGEERPGLASLACFAMIVAIAWWFSTFASGPAAYFHIGAILGTVMAANVWMRIIPAQRALVEATRRGEKPEAVLGLRAKQRSIHNNYMTLPVVFIMISIHFPSTWGHEWNWLILVLISLVGAGVRHYFNLRNRGREQFWILPAAALAMIGVYYLAHGI
ncbi:MAG: urate hydroxylase PuuD [Alphaproteobacteria bacterium]|nr:urate hydroxylase PuuD [Alphaproteobacteria bacterium]